MCISCFGFQSIVQKNIHLYVCMGNWTLERKFGEKQCCHSQQALICHSPTMFFFWETMFLVKQSETKTSVDIGTLRHMIIGALSRSADFFMELEMHSLFIFCIFCCVWVAWVVLSCTNDVGAIFEWLMWVCHWCIGLNENSESGLPSLTLILWHGYIWV